MVFQLFCMSLIALLFGQVLVFGGYRLFMILLPIWGFFFGFGLGAQTVQVLFGIGFLATVSSWVAGFIVGAIFAVLSYLFYYIAVALLSGSLGYGLAVGLLTAIGLDFGFLVWLIGIVAGAAVAVLVLYFNVQKYAIIVTTAIAGTSVIIFTLLAMFGNFTPEELLVGPVRAAIQNSFLWLIFFLGLSAIGIAVQLLTTRRYEIVAYDRLADEVPA
jgi:hypothetical protein